MLKYQYNIWYILYVHLINFDSHGIYYFSRNIAVFCEFFLVTIGSVVQLPVRWRDSSKLTCAGWV